MGVCTSKPSVASPGHPQHVAPAIPLAANEPRLSPETVDRHKDTLAPVELTFLAGSSLGSKIVEVIESGCDLPADDGTARPTAELLFRMYDLDRDGLLNDAELTAALRAFAVHAHAVAGNDGHRTPLTEQDLADVVASLRSQLAPPVASNAASNAQGVTLGALVSWLEGCGLDDSASAPAAEGGGFAAVTMAIGDASGTTPAAMPAPSTAQVVRDAQLAALASVAAPPRSLPQASTAGAESAASAAAAAAVAAVAREQSAGEDPHSSSWHASSTQSPVPEPRPVGGSELVAAAAPAGAPNDSYDESGAPLAGSVATAARLQQHQGGGRRALPTRDPQGAASAEPPPLAAD